MTLLSLKELDALRAARATLQKLKVHYITQRRAVFAGETERDLDNAIKRIDTVIKEGSLP